LTYAEKCDTEIETIQYLKMVMKDDTIELMMPNLDIGETIKSMGCKRKLSFDRGILLR